jgi:hypothetical protein
MPNLKSRYSISADELHARMERQEEVHNKPIRNTTELLDQAISHVIKSLGVDVTLSDDMIQQQQIALNIIITEHPPEEMGELSGFYVSVGEIPIAIICDPYLASDGLAYVNIMWINGERLERFGKVKIAN